MQQFTVGPRIDSERAPVSWIYFHCDAEDINAKYLDKHHIQADNFIPPDLVGCDLPPADGLFALMPEGEYTVTHVGGADLLAFVWLEGEAASISGVKIQRGLIVHPLDTEAVKYARQCYREKRNRL